MAAEMRAENKNNGRLVMKMRKRCSVMLTIISLLMTFLSGCGKAGEPNDLQLASKKPEKIVINLFTAIDGVEAVSYTHLDVYKRQLMDIQMPEMDGYEAARMIRSDPRPDAGTIPIIAMTANAFEQDVNAALEAGMNAHIAKPLDVNVLYEKLARELD